jgi:glycosyltransferase involved in cell wall biosynthesis
MNALRVEHSTVVGQVSRAGKGEAVADKGADVRPSVYVHLAHGHSPNTWAKAYEEGLVFEKQPYGYHWAQPWVRLSYSTDAPESKMGSGFRRGLRFLLGFDLVHAFRNRKRVEEAQVIWTHTEGDYLADAFLMKLGLIRRIPLVGQSIWLWDKWSNWNALRQRLHRWLLAEVTVATTHSALNAELGSEVLGRTVVPVPFGIEPSFEVPISQPRDDGRLRVVAPGNDRHRDWETLQRVARDNPDIEVVVLSARRRARRLVSAEVPNFVVRRAVGINDLIAAYTAADVVAVPLLRNTHVSGITVAMEGINAGRPVVVTRTGGIESYLGDTAEYVEPEDAPGMAAAIRAAAALGADADLQRARRRHLAEAGLLIKDFGRRHVLLTRLALGVSTPEEERAISRFAPVRLDDLEQRE